MSIPRLDTIGYLPGATGWALVPLPELTSRPELTHPFDLASPPNLSTWMDRTDGRESTSPPDPAELAGAFRIRRLVEPELIAKACRLVSEVELDEVDAAVRRFPTGGDSAERRRAARALYTRLLAPAASPWDLRVLTPLWAETDRWVRAWSRRLDGFRAPAAGEVVMLRALLADMRAKAAERARERLEWYLDTELRRLRRLFGHDRMPDPNN